MQPTADPRDRSCEGPPVRGRAVVKPEPVATAPSRRVTGAITLVLIHDEETDREGLVARLRAQPGARVLASAADVEEALRQVRKTTPDVVLLSLPAAGADGLALAGAVHGAGPACHLLIVGLRSSPVDVAGLVRAGAAGFIMAHASLDQFRQTIQVAVQGTRVLPMELTGALFAQLHHQPVSRRRRSTLRRLTGRARAVADLIGYGVAPREISRRLRLPLPVVQRHVRAVLSRLAGNGRLEVATLPSQRAAPVAAPDPPGPDLRSLILASPGLVLRLDPDSPV
jgi:DNA-binding NarL/FixJ family response regulator